MLAELARLSNTDVWREQAAQVMQVAGFGIVHGMSALGAIGDIRRFGHADELARSFRRELAVGKAGFVDSATDEGFDVFDFPFAHPAEFSHLGNPNPTRGLHRLLRGCPDFQRVREP